MGRKEDSKAHKSVKEVASQNDLLAPLSWAQRLKIVYYMMCSPSDYPPPFVWGNYAVLSLTQTPFKMVLDHIKVQPPLFIIATDRKYRGISLVSRKPFHEMAATGR